MKRPRVATATAVAALALGLAGCSAFGRAGASERPAATEVSPGQRFDVRLESNPTTGYSWAIRSGLDEKVLRLVGSTFVPPAPPAGGGPAPLGQGGHEVFTFEAVALGRTTLDFAYARPWEKGEAPVKIVEHVVRVR